jgi:predicted nucleic acid-binding protein
MPSSRIGGELLILYLDTSALIKLYIDEQDRDVVRTAAAMEELLAISIVGYPEARAALARKRREGNLPDGEHAAVISSLDSDWSGFSKLIVYDELARLAGEIAQRYELRGFDAIHLASAMYVAVQHNDLQFLGFDDRLNAAAVEAGLALYGEEPAGQG